MSQLNPTKALYGARTGHICDRCNKCVQTGVLMKTYEIKVESYACRMMIYF
jgi:predicted PP-loop superfamily ATPase